MDRASFHQAAQTQELIQQAKCKLVFLPPDSPEPNPIEKLWARIKAQIQSLVTSIGHFDLAVQHALLDAL